MGPEELAIAARLAGVKDVDAAPPVIVQAIVQRLGQTVGSDDEDPSRVERDCLKWLANSLRISIAPEAQVSAAEHRLFGPLLKQAARQTLPLWRVAAHMIALNTRTVRTDMIGLFERIAWRVLPQPDALEVIRQILSDIPPETAVASGIEIAGAVRADLAQLKEHPNWVDPTLLLILLLGFSDGKFNREEERFFMSIATGLDVTLEGAQRMRDDTTATFWSRRARLAPRNTEKPSEVRTNSLNAAYTTVEHIGLFNRLIDIVCSACVETVSQTAAASRPAWPMRLLAHLTGRSNNGSTGFLVLRVALMAYIQERSSSPTE